MHIQIQPKWNSSEQKFDLTADDQIDLIWQISKMILSDYFLKNNNWLQRPQPHHILR